MMIGILNYGVGNVRAFQNILQNNQVNVKLILKKSDCDDITKIILPGVGSFDEAMKLFNASGLRDHIEKLVIEQNIPILGICVGMQMLAQQSEEGSEMGLGWINGKVKKFDKKDISLQFKLPHMGWNQVLFKKEDLLISGMTQLARFYFLHSYFFLPDNEDEVLGVTNYGQNFCSIVKRNNIIGVQFHPEKSHDNGRNILLNFSKI
jgi:glutamine amidotransferase